MYMVCPSFLNHSQCLAVVRNKTKMVYLFQYTYCIQSIYKQFSNKISFLLQTQSSLTTHTVTYETKRCTTLYLQLHHWKNQITRQKNSYNTLKMKTINQNIFTLLESAHISQYHTLKILMQNEYSTLFAQVRSLKLLYFTLLHCWTISIQRFYKINLLNL